jgi:pyruvate dehydrogenase E1 component
VYARAFLEGRLSEDALRHYRRELVAQELGIQGLTSYPHPYLMPDFWQFPTGSMGIGPINAIYQARFMRYLAHRGVLDTAARKVWGFFGDGEMDEPESIAALTLAARERLDNCIFVINCNLQRLDGPVRGNGRIVDELEALFAGAGWNVVKCLWGSEWDALLARDHEHAIEQAFAQTVDGEFQTLSANDGAFNRRTFFSKTPQLQALVAHLTDGDIDRLRRGGHDPVKIHAAFAAALAHAGRPTVVLAKTMKGYGMGSVAQGRMTTHQHKKLDREELLEFRDRFQLPLTDEQVTEARGGEQGVALPARQARCPWRRPSTPHGRRPDRRGARSGAHGGLRAECRRQGHEHDHGLRPATGCPAQGPGARAAHRADRRRRGAHLRDGQPVPTGRHLRAVRPAVPA